LKPSLIARTLAVLVAGLLTLLSAVPAAWAARDSDSYDGNIYALYGGNGSLVPPRTSLAEALAGQRPVVLAFYLDDSRDSKSMAPVFNELQRLWGRTAELILLPTDPLQNRADQGHGDPAHYWKGTIPQVLVFDREGTVVFDQSGQVGLDGINAALSQVTGLKPQGESSFSLSREVNELNSEIRPAG
jgi:hypothetical protein